MFLHVDLVYLQSLLYKQKSTKTLISLCGLCQTKTLKMFLIKIFCLTFLLFESSSSSSLGSIKTRDRCSDYSTLVINTVIHKWRHLRTLIFHNPPPLPCVFTYTLVIYRRLPRLSTDIGCDTRFPQVGPSKILGLQVINTNTQCDNKINLVFFILYDMGTIVNKTVLTRPHLGGTTR